jgi:hypothetical protein
MHGFLMSQITSSQKNMVVRPPIRIWHGPVLTVIGIRVRTLPPEMQQRHLWQLYLTRVYSGGETISNSMKEKSLA